MLATFSLRKGRCASGNGFVGIVRERFDCSCRWPLTELGNAASDGGVLELRI